MDRPKQTSSFTNICFLYISFAYKFSEIFFVANSLGAILNNSFSFQLLEAWYLCVFLYFPWFSRKMHYSLILKNIFFKIFFKILSLSSAYICVHINTWFNQAFWLDLMILCTFFNINPWFNTCLMCIKYLSLSCTFAAKLLNFSSFQFLWKLNINFKKTFFTTFIITAFYSYSNLIVDCIH